MKVVIDTNVFVSALNYGGIPGVIYPILACAFEANAEVIVTGDKDLLPLGNFEGIEIATPRQFLERLAAKG